MTVSEFINGYQTAPDEAVLNALHASNFLAVSVAAFETVNRGLNGKDYLDALQVVSEREDIFWKPYTVGDLATAAYHLLSGVPYNGDNPEVSHLISSRMRTAK